MQASAAMSAKVVLVVLAIMATAYALHRLRYQYQVAWSGSPEAKETDSASAIQLVAHTNNVLDASPGSMTARLVAHGQNEPNPPAWPSSVQVFDEKTHNLSRRINDLFREMGPVESGKFSDRRTALMFKPGVYDIDVPVGYYTQVLGLGMKPADVEFKGQHGFLGPGQEDNNNFDTFWKAVENVANRPASKQTIWSVSQAAPLRRCIIHGDLLLGQYNTSAPNPVAKGSGGFIANTRVTGKLDFLLQQQWIVRNSQIGSSTYYREGSRGVNFVFVGTIGAPAQTDFCTNASSNPISPTLQELVEETSPLTIEKPYITIAGDKYTLVTPRAVLDAKGVNNPSNAYMDGFEKVFVATNSTSVEKINAKLHAGLHVVLTPGIYFLEEPIQIGWNIDLPYQVLLGLGMATLIPTTGQEAVKVGPAGGVRIAGLLLQAGHLSSKRLLHWTSSEGHPSNPGLLADIFARVGGPDAEEVAADVMLELSGGHVVMDNIWAWRADCCQKGCGTCMIRYCDHGLVVNGQHVTAYGLFSEHCQKDLTIWNAEKGRVYFYQSEMDSFAREAWDHTPDYGDNGVSGYRVNAKTHMAVGIGVYAYFSQRGNKVKAGTVVTHKDTLSTITCPFKWNLNPAWWNNSESGIELAVEFRAAQSEYTA